MLALLALAAGCAPAFEDDPGRVDAPRVLAVRAEPAERAPGEPVTLTALVAAPAGEAADAPRLAWCATPRPIAEGRVAAEPCLDGSALADGPPTTVPTDACARFGSEPAPAPDRSPRPADPDATGGYYQPVQVALADEPAAVGRVRLRCALAAAPAPVAARFAREAPRNENPVLAAAPLAEVDGAWALAATADAPEGYLRYDRARADLVAATEIHEATWYATAGELTVADAAAGAHHARFRPADGPATVWLVLRDDRGGVAWVSWSR
ncbi:MAG: hypothetical protein R3F60_06020 [bacterium]